MTASRAEHQGFTPVSIDLPVEVHQGGSIWRQRLVDISLGGVATDQPETWDAQYNEPFTLVIHTGAPAALELHAWLQNVADGRLGFTVEHVDRENLQPLRALLQAHLPDPDQLDEELRLLEQAETRAD